MSDQEVMHQAREAEAKDFQENKKKEREREKNPTADIKEEFYELRNNKVIKITRMKNGNSYSSYVGTAKQCEGIIEKHKLNARGRR